MVAGRIVPALGELDSGGITRFLGIIDEALGDRPPGVQHQFGLLLDLVRWLPVLRWGTSFDRMDVRRQDRVLCWFQHNRVRLFRQGFWALKTMVFMGYYGQPELWSSIGYDPRPDGNEVLHA